MNYNLNQANEHGSALNNIKHFSLLLKDCIIKIEVLRKTLAELIHISKEIHCL